jgi:hypothetical protein
MSKDKVIFGEAIASDNLNDFLFEEEIVKKDIDDTILIEADNESETPLDLKDEPIEEGIVNKEEEFEELIDLKDAKDNSPYKKYVQTLVESGEWEFDGIEDPETGEQIPLADLDIDEELFNEIKKQQKEEYKSKIKEDILSSLDSTERKFLEFKKSGGDIKTYLQTLTTKEKVENLDISTDEGKVIAIRTYYENVLKKTPEWTEKFINRLIKDLDIDSEAEQAKDELDKIAKAQHDKVVKDTEQAAKQAEESRLKAIEDLKNTLKQDNLPTKELNFIVKGFTETDERGLTEIDRHYLTLRNDPKKAKLVWDMLTNTEEFVKKVSKEEVLNKDLKTFKTIKLARKTVNGNSKTVDDDFILELK